MSLNELVEMNNMFTPEELLEIINEAAEFDKKEEDDQLIDDFIVIAGMTEDEAIAAAANVKLYDNF
jgi:hypothetical protein